MAIGLEGKVAKWGGVLSIDEAYVRYNFIKTNLSPLGRCLDVHTNVYFLGYIGSTTLAAKHCLFVVN